MNAAIRVLPSAGLREMPRREVRIDARIDAKYAELTPQERRICDFLLEHLGDLAVFSAADISRETGVSKATVSRLFRKLDFADFREVKEHTRAMRRAGTPLAAPTRTGVPGSASTPILLTMRAIAALARRTQPWLSSRP